MADMSVTALLERGDTHIFSLSLRCRPESSSLGPAMSRHRASVEPSSLDEARQADGVSSSLVRLPHFHKAPSSDGAFFCAFRATHAFEHGSASGFAFVGLKRHPHKRLTLRTAFPRPPGNGHRPRPVTRGPAHPLERGLFVYRRLRRYRRRTSGCGSLRLRVRDWMPRSSAAYGPADRTQCRAPAQRRFRRAAPSRTPRRP